MLAKSGRLKIASAEAASRSGIARSARARSHMRRPIQAQPGKAKRCAVDTLRSTSSDSSAAAVSAMAMVIQSRRSAAVRALRQDEDDALSARRPDGLAFEDGAVPILDDDRVERGEGTARAFRRRADQRDRCEGRDGSEQQETHDAPLRSQRDDAGGACGRDDKRHQIGRRQRIAPASDKAAGPARRELEQDRTAGEPRHVTDQPRPLGRTPAQRPAQRHDRRKTPRKHPPLNRHRKQHRRKQPSEQPCATTHGTQGVPEDQHREKNLPAVMIDAQRAELRDDIDAEDQV
jgi:hypothetical protein